MSVPTLSLRSRFALLTVLSAFLIAIFGTPALADSTLPGFPSFDLGAPTVSAPAVDAPAPAADAAAPVDPSNYDYWNQIIQHQIPEVRDGAARYFPGGRYYLGQNGLEIRFTNRATQVIVGTAAPAGAALIGPDEALAWLMKNSTPMVAAALGKLKPSVTAAAALGGIEALVQTYYPGDKCLGLTLPPIWVVHYFNNVFDNLEALGNGEIPLGYGYNVPVWLESCS